MKLPSKPRRLLVSVLGGIAVFVFVRWLLGVVWTNWPLDEPSGKFQTPAGVRLTLSLAELRSRFEVKCRWLALTLNLFCYYSDWQGVEMPYAGRSVRIPVVGFAVARMDGRLLTVYEYLLAGCNMPDEVAGDPVHSWLYMAGPVFRFTAERVNPPGLSPYYQSTEPPSIDVRWNNQEREFAYVMMTASADWQKWSSGQERAVCRESPDMLLAFMTVLVRPTPLSSLLRREEMREIGARMQEQKSEENVRR
jgi:hypothetical protein